MQNDWFSGIENLLRFLSFTRLPPDVEQFKQGGGGVGGRGVKV